jgi:hypothetical protein
VSHSICTHQDWVDSRLFVVGSQTASLTLGPSFDHNLCCRCSNGPCEAIFDIYTSSPFQQYKDYFKERCFDLYNRALKLRESRRTPSSHFWECEYHPHTCLKVGLWHMQSTIIYPWLTSRMACLGLYQRKPSKLWFEVVENLPILEARAWNTLELEVFLWSTYWNHKNRRTQNSDSFGTYAKLMFWILGFHGAQIAIIYTLTLL